MENESLNKLIDEAKKELDYARADYKKAIAKLGEVRQASSPSKTEEDEAFHNFMLSSHAVEVKRQEFLTQKRLARDAARNNIAQKFNGDSSTRNLEVYTLRIQGNSYQKIGELYGISEQRARQICASVQKSISK